MVAAVLLLYLEHILKCTHRWGRKQRDDKKKGTKG
jgi:hypothetical protein